MVLSKSEYAYREIKEKILTGKLPPQTSISEDELQTELKVSRTPIREALRALCKEGFVDIYPRKCIMVSSISLDLLKEIYETRATIEPIITKNACGEIPDSFLLNIQDRLQSPPKNLADNKVADYYNELDSKFHTTLIKYTQNRFFVESMTMVSDHERRIRCVTFNIQTNHEVINQHLEIIRAMLDRDKDLVTELALKHVEHARRNAFYHFLGL